MGDNPVSITALVAERFKRIKAVEMRPGKSGLHIIGGKNQQGKTSILDAIVFALGGEKHKPSEAKNRDSEGYPEIRIELSNGLIVERKGKNSSLKVVDKNGLKGGQGVLDSFVESLALDLPRFLASTDKDKANTLLKIIGVDEKLASIEADYKSNYELRRDVKRDLDRLKKELGALVFHDDVSGDKVSMEAIIERLSDAQREHASYESVLKNIENKKGQSGILESRIKMLTDQISELKGELSSNNDAVSSMSDHAQKMSLPDIKSINDEMVAAESANAKVSENHVYKSKKSDCAKVEDNLTFIQTKLDHAVSAKDGLLESAKMPIAGLSVDDGCLTYKGLKWDCMSGVEQLFVATSIIRKLKPECGFVLLDKLEQMDVDSLEKFGDWALKEGLQIIATRVSTGDECSVIIEDGSVKE